MSNFTAKNRDKALLSKWLILCCLMVALMVFIGGITRLTGSGLSIVEWNPITGIIPPLNDIDWHNEFAKYQTSPEYQQHNFNITLGQFKFIFWLEFIHRLAGRLTGLIYLLPFLYFYVKRTITRNKLAYLAILGLFGTQGFIGWYMVKSGLIDKPYVSHFRLAAHLMIAVIIYSLLFWQLMKNKFDILLIAKNADLNSLKSWCLFTTGLVYGQITLGGLVAGLNAGLVYNTFPMMGDSFIPELQTISLHSLNDPVFIQFIHRMNSYIIVLCSSILTWKLLKQGHPRLNKLSCYIILSLFIQMLAGILTLLYSVPIAIALIHQMFAIVLLSYFLWCYFLLKSA